MFSSSGRPVFPPRAAPSSEYENPSSRRETPPPPELRRRDGETSAGIQPFQQVDAIHFHSDPAQRGARDTLTGTIQEVKCSIPAVMEITLVARRPTVRLFSENYFAVEYSALNFKPSGELMPCRDLKGARAQVFYDDLKGKPDQGELISVQLRK